MQKNLPLLIFDLDGVLVDSEPLSERLFTRCLQQDNFEIDAAFSHRYFMGRSLPDCLDTLQEHFGRQPSEGVLDGYAKQIGTVLETELQAIPFVPEALAQLPHRKCIASGSDPARIALSLKVTGLEKYFEQITSAYEVAKGKPEPDIFLKAAEKMGYAPHDCIVVEDTIFGVRAGVAAGMRVLNYQAPAVSHYEVPEAVVVFESMEQLPQLVNTISEA